jgi:DHA2 family multidrug resistance protein
MIGSMTVVLSMTTVNVAYPDIMGAFSIGREKAQLLSSGYFAAMTAGMVLSAWLITVFGERWTLAGMFTVFIVGSAMSGLATSTEALNFGRLLQGIGAGVIQPLTLAVTFKVFPPDRRGTAMGLYAMGMVFAPAIGPTLGGMAIEVFNWRYVFFLTLPSAVLATVAGFFFMPTKVVARPFPKFDHLGFVLLCAALFCLMLALASGQREGWTSDYIVVLLVLGALSAVAFVVWEHYAEVPLLNMALLRYPRFVSAGVIGFFSGCVFLTSTFLIPVFVQEIQGFTPLHAGLLLMPGGLSLLVLFPLAGRLSDHLPASFLIGSGMVSFIVAFSLFREIDVNTPFWTLVGWTMFIRLGLALTTPVVNGTALKAVPPELVNQASGGISLARQLGSAFGMSCVVAFLEARVPFHRDAFIARQVEVHGSGQILLEKMQGLMAIGGVSDASQYAGALQYFGQVLLAQANTLGFQDAFTALGLLGVVGLVPTLVLATVRDRKA